MKRSFEDISKAYHTPQKKTQMPQNNQEAFQGDHDSQRIVNVVTDAVSDQKPEVEREPKRVQTVKMVFIPQKSSKNERKRQREYEPLNITDFLVPEDPPTTDHILEDADAPEICDEAEASPPNGNMDIHPDRHIVLDENRSFCSGLKALSNRHTSPDKPETRNETEAISPNDRGDIHPDRQALIDENQSFRSESRALSSRHSSPEERFYDDGRPLHAPKPSYNLDLWIHTGTVAWWDNIFGKGQIRERQTDEAPTVTWKDIYPLYGALCPGQMVHYYFENGEIGHIGVAKGFEYILYEEAYDKPLEYPYLHNEGKPRQYPIPKYLQDLHEKNQCREDQRKKEQREEEQGKEDQCEKGKHVEDKPELVAFQDLANTMKGSK